MAGVDLCGTRVEINVFLLLSWTGKSRENEIRRWSTAAPNVGDEKKLSDERSEGVATWQA